MITRMLLAAIGLTFSTAVKKAYFSSTEINPDVDRKTFSALFLGLSALFFMTQVIFSF